MTGMPAASGVPPDVAGPDVPTCPFLGHRDDAAPVEDLPSSEHRCYKPPTPHPVRRDIQNRFCLTGRYQRCPVYRGVLATPPGPSLAQRLFGDAGVRGRLRTREGLAFLLFAMLVPAVIGIVFAVVSDNDEDPLRSSLNTAPPIQSLPTPPGQSADPDPGDAQIQSPSGEAAAAPAPSDDPAAAGEEPQRAPPAEDLTPREQLLAWDDLTEYVVGPGDNLGAIALDFGTTIEAIALHNGLADVNAITIGQVLAVPVGFILPIDLEQTAAGGEQVVEDPPPPDAADDTADGADADDIGAAPPDAEPPPAEEEPSAIPVAPDSLLAWPDIVEWEVDAGDTLFFISQDFSTTVDAIAALNSIDPSAPLQIGALLRVPRGFLEPIGEG